MGVLQPWLLALGAAMAVPLLLHLFQRHQGPRVVFPALRYLRRAEKESARRIRLRQWLLMLLRMALVLLVALAAARPFLLGAGAAHEPAAIVIILDNSTSTGALAGEARVLDALRARALETLERAGPDDRFWLLRAGAPGEPALAGDAATTAARIRETEPTVASADLEGALARARAILAAGAEGRAPEIQLLSDLQATELRGLATDAPSPPLVAWVPPGEPPPNRAITQVQLAGGVAPLAGVRAQLAVQVRGAEGTADTVTLRAFAGERLVAATAAPVGAAVLLPLPASEAGILRGRVEAEPDALRADDVRHFAARVVPPPLVSAAGASEFLREALAVMAEGGRVRTDGAGPADVVLASGAAGLAPPRPGGTLVVVPPAAAVELAAANGALARAGIPWSYAPGPQGGSTQLAVPDSADTLQRALQQVRLSQNYRLVRAGAPAGDSVLLRTREGEAWAVRGELRAGGRYILLASPLDAQATSIPVSAAMIPLLDRIIGAWASRAAELRELAAGAELVLPPGATAILRPDGERESISGARFTVPPQPGVFQVLADDSVLGAFALNPPAAESDLRRLRGRQLADAFRGWDLTTADDPARWARSVYRARLGLELWRPLLYAALLLLVLESIIAVAGSARPARAAATEAA